MKVKKHILLSIIMCVSLHGMDQQNAEKSLEPHRLLMQLSLLPGMYFLTPERKNCLILLEDFVKFQGELHGIQINDVVTLFYIEKKEHLKPSPQKFGSFSLPYAFKDYCCAFSDVSKGKDLASKVTVFPQEEPAVRKLTEDEILSLLNKKHAQ